jgi:hypothetical protein
MIFSLPDTAVPSIHRHGILTMDRPPFKSWCPLGFPWSLLAVSHNDKTQYKLGRDGTMPDSVGNTMVNVNKLESNSLHIISQAPNNEWQSAIIVSRRRQSRVILPVTV